MEAGGYTQPDRSSDRLGEPLLEPDGSEFRTPYPINDLPTRHIVSPTRPGAARTALA